MFMNNVMRRLEVHEGTEVNYCAEIFLMWDNFRYNELVVINEKINVCPRGRANYMVVVAKIYKLDCKDS